MTAENNDVVATGVDVGSIGDVRQQPDRRQILALSGGGYRGLYSAAFLASVESDLKCTLSERFDFLIGTSIGGLFAAALALKTPASDIVTKMVKHGPAIFPRRGFVTAAKRAILRAPYSAEDLKKAVIDTIGEDNAKLWMTAINKPLAICSVNYTHGRPEIFRSRGLAGARATKATVLQAVLASAAAPTYFPPQTLNQDSLIDGGLIANAPELLGVSDACGFLQYSFNDLYVLAIGTASRSKGAALTSLGRPSAASWLLRRRLFQTTLAAQEALATSQCEALLGTRYYKVDREPAENQVAAIRDFDLTDKLATDTLQSLARQSWEEHRSEPMFRSFFAHRPYQP
jgi:pimeloyl-ACP methyl ester carboxylesterase